MSAKFATKTGRVAAGGSLLVGGVAGALVLAPQAGAATTYHVTNTSDTGAGSLRQAIDDANNNAGADIIVFDAGSAGTITLTSGQLEITDDVTITGLGAADSIISGNNASRIFYIYNSAVSLTVSISGLTMTDGHATTTGGAIANWGNGLTLSSVVLTGNESTGTGGAVHSGVSGSPNADIHAPFTIIDSEISGNTAVVDAGGIRLNYIGDVSIVNTTFSGNYSGSRGGGASGEDVGNVSIVDSLFQNNESVDQGGGLHLYRAGDVSIDSTTFDHNIADVLGHGFGDGGGVYVDASDSVTMTNSTVSGNEASDGAGILLGNAGDVLIANSTIANNVGGPNKGRGGALYRWGSNGDTRILFSTISGNSTKNNTVRIVAGSPYTVEISGTIISDNRTNEGSDPRAVDLYLEGTASGTVTSSLIMGWSFGTPLSDGGGNINGVSAQLGALADNGGATFTMEPAAGSPVIDAGPLTWTAFNGDGSDQRGGLFLRVYNGQSDMGALEVQPEPVPPTTTTTAASGDTTTTVATDPVAPAFTG